MKEIRRRANKRREKQANDKWERKQTNGKPRLRGDALREALESRRTDFRVFETNLFDLFIEECKEISIKPPRLASYRKDAHAQFVFEIVSALSRMGWQQLVRLIHVAVSSGNHPIGMATRTWTEAYEFARHVMFVALTVRDKRKGTYTIEDPDILEYWPMKERKRPSKEDRMTAKAKKAEAKAREREDDEDEDDEEEDEEESTSKDDDDEDEDSEDEDEESDKDDDEGGDDDDEDEDDEDEAPSRGKKASKSKKSDDDDEEEDDDDEEEDEKPSKKTKRTRPAKDEDDDDDDEEDSEDGDNDDEDDDGESSKPSKERGTKKSKRVVEDEDDDEDEEQQPKKGKGVSVKKSVKAAKKEKNGGGKKFKTFKVVKKFAGGGNKEKVFKLVSGTMPMPKIAKAAKEKLGITMGEARSIVKGLAAAGYLERVK